MTLNPTSTKLLQLAGAIAIITAPAHYVMGKTELQSGVKNSGMAGNTALKGWYQGCFMYLVFGLNYLRLAQIPFYTTLDQLTLLSQAAMHLYTLLDFKQPPPRALSAVILGLLSASSALKA